MRREALRRRTFPFHNFGSLCYPIVPNTQHRSIFPFLSFFVTFLKHQNNLPSGRVEETAFGWFSFSLFVVVVVGEIRERGRNKSDDCDGGGETVWEQ